MKAIIVNTPKKAEVLDVEGPKADGKNVLIRSKYAGICGGDLHNGWASASMPGLALGHEYSGVVIDPGASGLKTGDRVAVMELTPCMECSACKRGLYTTCRQVIRDSAPGFSAHGGMGEYSLVRPDMVVKLPDSIDDIVGALIEPASIGMHALKSAGFKKGDSVLLLGTGPIAMFAAAVLRALGASYIGMTEVNEKRIKFARNMGYADDVFVATDPELTDKVLKATNGEGVDLLFDCMTAPTDMQMFSMLRKGGTYIIIGLTKTVTLDKLLMTRNEYKVIGCTLFYPEDFKDVMNLLESSKLNIRNLVTRIAEFDEAQECFTELASGDTAECKILFRVP